MLHSSNSALNGRRNGSEAHQGAHRKTTAKKEALDSEDEVAGRRRLRRSDWRDRRLARCGATGRREEILGDVVGCEARKERSNGCGRNLRADLAAIRFALAWHAHVHAASVCRRLCRNHARCNRQQQHPHQGDGNRRPLADSSQHGSMLPLPESLAVTGVTVRV